MLVDKRMPSVTSFSSWNAPTESRLDTRPLSLFTAATDPSSERYLTQTVCEALFHRIRQLAQDGDTRVRITSRWRGTTRWVHNSLLASSDQCEHRVSITRFIKGARGEATTNQFDDVSLQIAVATAERQANREPLDVDRNFASGAHSYLAVDLFKPATYNLDAPTRAAAASALVAPAAATGVLAAGYLEVRASTIAVYDTGGLRAYAMSTAAQYTVTVRDAEGTASGWAGQDHTDWTKIDAAALAKSALEKCLAAKNPAQIEPGRYTVVLEPQAVHALMRIALGANVLMRSDNERSDLFPYNMRRPPRHGLGTSKIGVQIMDPRITVGTDPQDPDGGYVSFDQDGVPYTPVQWIEQGVLQQLPYDPDYALERLNSGVAHPYTASFRMSGGSATVDEMVASTERGVLVTRFVGVRLRHTRSLLVTGTTADGTWLIEHGQRTKAIKNLRFNVSLLEVFNQVQELGRRIGCSPQTHRPSCHRPKSRTFTSRVGRMRSKRFPRTRRRTQLLSLLLVGMLLGGHKARAQQTPDFLHPLRDTAAETRYDGYTPGECLNAVERVGALARRTEAVRPDAWQQSFLENDTVYTVERQAAATCVQHLDLATTAPRTWPDLARVYWFAGDTTRMHQAITRRLALDTTANDRATTDFQLLTRFLLTRQRDITLAGTILAGLDSLTNLTAQAARVQVHTALAYTFAASREPGAEEAAQAQIELALQSFSTMPAIEQSVMVDTVGPLFELGVSEATERNDTARVHALLALARTSLSHLDNGASYVHNAEAVVRYFGMLAPPIHADFVYGKGAGIPGGVWPRPGRWTLVSALPSGAYLAGFYRHLQATLGDRLDLVFVATTNGNWFHRGPLTAAQEAEHMDDYVQHRWRIPQATLLVEERTFRTMPDGRRQANSAQTPDIYTTDGVVIDPEGKIRAMVQPSTLARFDQLLATLMQPEVSHSSAPPKPLPSKAPHSAGGAGR